MLPSGIRFVLCCFRSTLITASLLLSFPAGTKILQFPAFPIVSNELRHPWFNACMRLAMAFRSLPRPSSALEPSYPLNGLRILKPTGLPMQQSQLHDSALKDFVVRTQLARRTISLALDGTCSAFRPRFAYAPHANLFDTAIFRLRNRSEKAPNGPYKNALDFVETVWVKPKLINFVSVNFQIQSLNFYFWILFYFICPQISLQLLFSNFIFNFLSITELSSVTR